MVVGREAAAVSYGSVAQHVALRSVPCWVIYHMLLNQVGAGAAYTYLLPILTSTFCIVREPASGGCLLLCTGHAGGRGTGGWAVTSPVWARAGRAARARARGWVRVTGAKRAECGCVCCSRAAAVAVAVARGAAAAREWRLGVGLHLCQPSSADLRSPGRLWSPLLMEDCSETMCPSM